MSANSRFTKPVFKKSLIKIVIITATLLTCSGLVVASDLPDGPHIATTGSASIDAMPDMAHITIEVNATAKDAITAKQQADKRVSDYLAFLHKNGIQQADIDALNLRTQPEYQYEKGKSHITGYKAVRSVKVKLRQPDKLNSLLNGALNAGLNEVRSVTLGVAQPESYQQQARQSAVKNAIHQAQQLADSFNSTLGNVYSINYQPSGHQPEVPAYALRMQASDSNQDTYQTPVIHFTDQVSVVFHLTAKNPQQPEQIKIQP